MNHLPNPPPTLLSKGYLLRVPLSITLHQIPCSSSAKYHGAPWHPGLLGLEALNHKPLKALNCKPWKPWTGSRSIGNSDIGGRDFCVFKDSCFPSPCFPSSRIILFLPDPRTLPLEPSPSSPFFIHLPFVPFLVPWLGILYLRIKVSCPCLCPANCIVYRVISSLSLVRSLCSLPPPHSVQPRQSFLTWSTWYRELSDQCLVITSNRVGT